MQVDPYRAVVGAKDIRLNVGVSNPWQKAGCDEDIVYTRAVVGRSSI